MTADDLRQELIATWAASTGTERARWETIITRIIVDLPNADKLSNWSVETRCGHRKAPFIRHSMNNAIKKLRQAWPYVDPSQSRLAGPDLRR